MLGDEKSPQEAFARAAAAFADDEAHAQRIYDYVSNGWFMYATPLLANGGTKRGLPISCFLTTAEDSLKGIVDHWGEIAHLSAKGGGVGGYWPLRSNGEKTSKGSSSNGMIPFICVVDREILSVSQGGTRRGSYAAYVDIFHPEVEEFITARKPTGGDDNRKIINLHNAVCITDKFMIAVRDDLPFDLYDIHSGVVHKTVQARDLWRLLIETRKQTGEPYMFFVDTANDGLPEPQKKKGLRVHQSNLCVAPYTEILTSQGYAPIAGLAGESVSIWNGEDWSEVTIEQTNTPGVPQELVRVLLDDGSFIDCTPYHKFYDIDGKMIRAGELEADTPLEVMDHPTIRFDDDIVYDEAKAYAAGYTTFSGYEDKNRLSVFLNDGNKAIAKRLMTYSVDAEYNEDLQGLYIHYETQSIPAAEVPFGWNPESRLAWLGGVMDAQGEWIESDNGEMYLTVATPDTDMVHQMRLAFLEVGLNPRVRVSDNLGGFMLSAHDVNRLAMGNYILSEEYDPELISAPENIQIVRDVIPLPWKADTYCFTESKRGKGVFNGTLTGNCTEITLATGRDDQGMKRTAVCCLSSVNAEKFDEWKDHPTFIEDLMRMLDNCLQVFIDTAPPELAYAIYSATMERSVGLGLLGFHAYLQKHMIAFESDEAREVNTALFQKIRRDADAASLVLGAERGEAPDMIGTGERFAHKIAVAPNASSSILCGNTSPSIEPSRANAFLHKTLSGSFPVKNPYLERELRALGLDNDEIWKQIIGDEGSVQNLGQTVVHGEEMYQYFGDGIVTVDVDGVSTVFDDTDEGVFVPLATWDHLTAVFKTFIEIDMRKLVQLAVDRQPYIDQAQSVNLAFVHDADAEYMSESHYMAWAGGLKSLYYLRSTTAKRAENTNTKVERNVMAEAAPEPIMNGLSANAADDSTCISCEG